MEKMFSGLRDLVSDPSVAWTALEEKGHHVLDLMRGHPWTTLGIATGTALIWSNLRSPWNLPPGPLNLPLIGAPSCLSDVGIKMLAWRRKYGDVVSYYKFGSLFVILNNEKTIREAFVKRGEEFAHRSEYNIFQFVGYNDEVFTAPYNETWKKNRKFAVGTLRNFGFGNIKSEEKIHRQIDLLEDFLLMAKGSPIDISEDLKTFSAGVISSIVLGEASSWEDENLVQLGRLMSIWYEGLNDVVGAVEMYNDALSPCLVKLLCRKSFKQFKERNQVMIDYLVRRIEEHKKDFSRREPEDVVDAYLNEKGVDEINPTGLAHTIIVFLTDSIDTAALMDLWLLFYTAYYPEVQKKLRAELESVCGQNRPTLADRQAMPYTQAVIQEAFRLNNGLQTSLARRLRKNVEFNGYRLPKGATIMANFYAIEFDPEIFQDPFKFNPSRFIDENGKFNGALASRVLTFSLGTRGCIGETFMKMHMFLYLTRILHRFDFEFDPAARKPTADSQHQSLVNKPDNFKMCFRPRY